MIAALYLILASTAWGQRQQLPEFIAGDQCLFCHRNDIGPSWQKNAHNLTVRPKDESTELFTLGSRKHRRELKKTGYGKFTIQESGGTWNASKFADRCAGCHSTAVDARTRAFAEFGIDCYACHGVVNLEHSNGTSLILLSKKNRNDGKSNAICASCHLRGGKSKTTGLPYPHHYVAGDDLFQDWQADIDLESLNPGDRHVWRSARSDVSCLDCHQVHANSTARHRRVLTSAICNDCHFPTGPKKNVRAYTVTSALCEY